MRRLSLKDSATLKPKLVGGWSPFLLLSGPLFWLEAGSGCVASREILIVYIVALSHFEICKIDFCQQFRRIENYLFRVRFGREWVGGFTCKHSCCVDYKKVVVESDDHVVEFCHQHRYVGDMECSCVSDGRSTVHQRLNNTGTTHRVGYSYLSVPQCGVATAIKHPVPDGVKPSFVIFDIRALKADRQSARMTKITNNGLIRSGTVCLNSCIHLATVG